MFSNTRVKLGLADGALRWMSVPSDMTWEAFTEAAVTRFGSEAMKLEKSKVIFVCEGAEVDSVDLFRENDSIIMRIVGGNNMEDSISPVIMSNVQSPTIARPCTPPHLSPILGSASICSPMFQESENFLVEVCRVIQNYDALPDGEQLTIRVGEQVEIVSGEKSGWSYARKANGVQGWVPACCLDEAIESRYIPFNEQIDSSSVNRFVANTLQDNHITQPAAGSMPSTSIDAPFSEHIKHDGLIPHKNEVICKNDTQDVTADSHMIAQNLSHCDSHSTNDFANDSLRLNFTAKPFLPSHFGDNTPTQPQTVSTSSPFTYENSSDQTPTDNFRQENSFEERNHNSHGNFRKHLRPAGGEMITATGAVVTPMGASIVHKEVRGATVGTGGYLVGYGKGGQLCERYHCTRCGLNELEKGCRMLPCDTCHFARYCSEDCTELDVTRHMGSGECRRFKQKVMDYNCAIWGSPAPPKFASSAHNNATSPTTKLIKRDLSPYGASPSNHNTVVDTPTAGARMAPRMPKIQHQVNGFHHSSPNMMPTIPNYNLLQMAGGARIYSNQVPNNQMRWTSHVDVANAAEW
eukprot:GDKK01040344.1.p1 GENE.GDKK01040344.1~~GDKK01040344.1.p1  ORF type:complete len:578 (-),score=128.26 GDKK01040344.1:1410-3143(-)